MSKSVFLAVFPLIWLTGCAQQTSEAHSETTRAPVAVRATPVSVLDWPSTYEATGTVRARAIAAVSSRLMASVRDVKVQLGDHVREGQVLIVLDSRDLETAQRRAAAARDEAANAIAEAESAIAAAKANVDLSQVTFNRMEDLFKKKSISNQEFDEASAHLKAAQASFEMARSRRAQLDAKLAQTQQEIRAAEVNQSYADIAAPFAGIVVTKSVEPGNVAIPGVPLLSIEREGAYRLEAEVDASRLGRIRIGQAVTVKLDGSAQAFSGRISEIVPEVDAAARAGTVKIDLPAQAEIRSGTFGRAIFSSGARKIIAVPATAVMERGQLQSVFVVENGTAHTRLITTGERAGDSIEVLSGLNAGEQVVFSTPRGLSDGSPVEIQP